MPMVGRGGVLLACMRFEQAPPSAPAPVCAAVQSVGGPALVVVSEAEEGPPLLQSPIVEEDVYQRQGGE